MSRTWQLVAGPVYLTVLGLGLALALLIAPLESDPSYTCTGSTLTTLIHPEPEASGQFRANFFDVGWQCNRDARFRGVTAGLVAAPFVIGSVVWVWVRRRSGMY